MVPSGNDKIELLNMAIYSEFSHRKHGDLP